MTQGEQYRMILMRIANAEKELHGLKNTIKSLQSINGQLAAEIHMLADRIDIFVNQDFARKAVTEKKKSA